jgi:hypothetical protein
VRGAVAVSTRRILGIVLLVVGAALLYYGAQATDTPVEQAREALTGDYSDETMLYLICGAAAFIGGLVLLLTGKRS